MALQGSGKNLGTLDAQPDAIIFNSGESCLRDARPPSQLILAVPLQFSNNAHRLPHRYFNALSCWTKSLHPKPSDSRAGLAEPPGTTIVRGSPDKSLDILVPDETIDILAILPEGARHGIL
jgi:hypothetical protein